MECKNSGVCAEHDLWNRHAVPVFQSASEQALVEAHAEIARLTAECERVKEELKEALVGVCYGRMCEKELFALRARRKASVTSGRGRIFGNVFSPDRWVVILGLVTVFIVPGLSAWLLV